MIEKLRNYIKDNEFRLTLLENKVHIINYSEILSLDSKRISIQTNDNMYVIKGYNLVLNRLLDNEVLIDGVILSIEVFYD